MKPSICCTGFTVLKKTCLIKPSKHKLAYYIAQVNDKSNPLYQQLLITETSEKVFNEVSFKHLPILRHLAEIDVNEDQCQELLNTLEMLTMYAYH